MPNEEKTFLDEFKAPVIPDPFEHLEVKPEETPAPEENPEEVKDNPEPQNRRERRLMAKLEAEKESAIKLAARLEAITEAQNSRTEESEYISAIEKLYGTETPEAREATETLKFVIKSAAAEAKREALQEFESKRSEEQQAVSEAEKQIDSMLESLEDEYNVDLMEGPHREPFLKLLEKMSPKDSSGNIVAYADHVSVWETYQERLNSTKSTNPAKSLAARSMATGNSSTESSLGSDVHERWLKERGII